MIDFLPRTTEIIPLTRLHNNTGQIPGLPANPRTINREKYERLKQSLIDNPEFLESNPLKVIEHEGGYVIIGGNMRKRALTDLGYKAVPCAVLDPATPPEKLRAYTVLDNSDFGRWDIDMLANEWQIGELEAFGLDCERLFGLDTPEPQDPALDTAEEKSEEKSHIPEEKEPFLLRVDGRDIELSPDDRFILRETLECYTGASAAREPRPSFLLYLLRGEHHAEPDEAMPEQESPDRRAVKRCPNR